jgi:hypothetical protein
MCSTLRPYRLFVRWSQWLVGWLAGVVLAGGIAYVLTAEESPLRPFGDPVVVDTTIREVVVLPVDQAEISGTLARLEAEDAVGPAIPLPLTVETGRATIEGAVVDGRRTAVVWDGGRPLVLTGTGAVDLGPTRVIVEGGTTTWPLDDGVRLLLPGEYRIDTPVAVGDEGLAEPRDGVAFTADGDTTMETTGIAVSLPTGALHLEGPGTLTLEGDLVVRTRAGERTASRLLLAEGPFVVDLEPGGRFTATVRGDLTVE